jgi:hypothetical protein
MCDCRRVLELEAMVMSVGAELAAKESWWVERTVKRHRIRRSRLVLRMSERKRKGRKAKDGLLF